MPDLSLADRLQPSLLDRLTDDHPTQTKESRAERVLSVRRLRECVRRDVAWLLNTTDLNTVNDLSAYSEVATSVVNYGIPELTGRTIAGLEVDEISELIKQAILRFEPRVLPHTLEVRGIKHNKEYSDRSLGFEISGQLWAQPVPQELYLRTELDLELGNINVTER